MLRSKDASTRSTFFFLCSCDKCPGVEKVGNLFDDRVSALGMDDNTPVNVRQWVSTGRTTLNVIEWSVAELREELLKQASALKVTIFIFCFEKLCLRRSVRTCLKSLYNNVCYQMLLNTYTVL